MPAGIKEYFRKLYRSIEHNAGRTKQLETRVASLERMIDTLISNPVYHTSDDVGFNGQHGRKQILLDLLRVIPFKNILETGTFMGDTTGYMAEQSRRPVYTSELNPRFSMFARKRLAAFDSIHFSVGDSREFLRQMAGARIEEPVFFYLDAHWYDDLPLLDECNLILQNWRDVVILVDDFKSPLDNAYGFDDYGNGRELSLEYLAPAIKTNDLLTFFPAMPASEESGLRRGCVVLARRQGLGPAVAGVKSLIAVP